MIDASEMRNTTAKGLYFKSRIISEQNNKHVM